VLALVKGEINDSSPTLCRMHRGALFSDVFSSSVAGGGHALAESALAIERQGSGVIVYLPPHEPLGVELESDEASDSTAAVIHTRTLREYGLGAQVLRELGVRRLRLLTNNPRRIPGLHGHGLDLVECVPISG
jgi:3,4-dihydroxy 2-butanone 4-phosphate synthase/GTP cyclohydrolase II